MHSKLIRISTLAVILAASVGTIAMLSFNDQNALAWMAVGYVLLTVQGDTVRLAPEYAEGTS